MSASVLTRNPPAEPSTSPWLIRHGCANGREPRLRLLCLHYAGASASIFRSWPEALPDEVQVVAIQLPGRDYRLAEPLVSDMRELVEAIAKDLPPMLDRPYVFFGHSMGALLAFDLVRFLRTHGLRQPELLIASGRNAPQFRWCDPSIHLLPDKDLVNAVREYNGTPEILLRESALRELWLPRFRADLTASVLYEYVPQPPLGCPILVMFGEEDVLVTEAGLQGWREHSIGGVSFAPYAGDHFFLHSAEDQLLAQLRRELQARLTGL